jgi:hypothetical protein
VYIGRLTASSANAVPLWLLWLCLGLTVVGILIPFTARPQSAQQADGDVEKPRSPTEPGTRVRVSRTGRATAGPGGRANSGVSGPAGSLPEDVLVDRTGDADASNGGDANSGIQLT